MKMKSFVMLAATGIVAASCAYMVPAMADDMGGLGGGMGSALGSSMGMGSGMTGDMGSATDGLGMPSSATGGSMSATSAIDGTSTSAMMPEQGIPDTATGDDEDY